MSVKTHTLIVAQKYSGDTLLSFLRENLKELPSVKAVKRAIDGKKCKINGRVEFFSTHRVKTGDKIEIVFGDQTPEYVPQVLFEDDALIIFNKPPGTIVESISDYILVHRLDKDTSGAIVFAKTQEVEKALLKLFADRKVEKLYFAICDKKVAQEKWKIDNFLGKKASYEGGSLYGKAPKERGKRAVTLFTTLKTSPTASLLSVQPVTGRTHQIRVHLKEYGHPILGDWQYGKQFTCKMDVPRQMLHAATIVFPHPLTGEEIRIEAPHFPDFLEVEKALFGA